MLDEMTDGLNREIQTSARQCEETARLTTIPANQARRFESDASGPALLQMRVGFL